MSIINQGDLKPALDWVIQFTAKVFDCSSAQAFSLVSLMDDSALAHSSLYSAASELKGYGPLVLVPMAYVYDMSWPGNDNAWASTKPLAEHFGTTCLVPMLHIFLVEPDTNYVAARMEGAGIKHRSTVSFLFQADRAWEQEIGHYINKYMRESNFYVRYFAAIVMESVLNSEVSRRAYLSADARSDVVQTREAANIMLSKRLTWSSGFNTSEYALESFRKTLENIKTYATRLIG